MNNPPDIRQEIAGPPEDWQNNTSTQYKEFYAAMSIELPPVKVVGERIGQLLTSTAEENKDKECEKTLYHLAAPPPLPMTDYLARLSSFSMCSPEVYVIALVYIDKYHEARGGGQVCPTNVHK